MTFRRHDCSKDRQKSRALTKGTVVSTGPLDAFVQGTGCGKPTADEKKEVAEYVTKWLAQSGRPFRVAEDPGLADLLEAVMRMA